MKQKEFDERIKLFKIGDHVRLYIRGNYGDYVKEGIIQKINRKNRRISLLNSTGHSYARIISMR